MKKGFTLIELLVVSTIIVTLIGIASVSYVRATRSARDARRTTDLEQIRQALETFRAENGVYPTTAEGTAVLDPNYISVVPTGPKTDTYNYTRNTTTTYTLCATLEIVPVPPATGCGTGNYKVTNP